MAWTLLWALLGHWMPIGSSATSLHCELYNLATAQVLAQGLLAISNTNESSLELIFVDVQGRVMERPLDNEWRLHRLEMVNSSGERDVRDMIYRLTDLLESKIRLPPASVEIPGLGDTLQLHCDAVRVSGG